VPILIFEKASQAYPLNYIACVAAVTVSEVLLLLIYSVNLCMVSVEECLEGVDGFKLTQINS
jgi:hypothetical protein